MDKSETREWLTSKGGAASTPEVASLLDVSEREVRELAAELGVKTISNAYVWTLADLLRALASRGDLDTDDDPDDVRQAGNVCTWGLLSGVHNGPASL